MTGQLKRASDSTIVAALKLFVDLLNGISIHNPRPESVFLFPQSIVRKNNWRADPVLARAIRRAARREANRGKGRGQTEADWERFIQAIDAARLPCGPVRPPVGDAVKIAKSDAARELAHRKAAKAAPAEQFRNDTLKRLTRKAKQWRRKPVSVLQEQISPLLWRCGICSNFFLARNGRKRLYCSDGCKNMRPKRDEMKALRTRVRKDKLNRAKRALAAWNGRGDWKAFVAAKAKAKTGITKNWLTYSVKTGDLKPPA